jgi:hypothetical protein
MAILFFISGKNHVGKNSFVDALGKAMQAGPSIYAGNPPMLIDTSAPIKAACSLLGWDGVKTSSARQLLADVYKAATSYNCIPISYLINRVNAEPSNSVFVVMVRQYDIIQMMREQLRCTSVDKILSVLINRPLNVINPSESMSAASEPAQVEDEFIAAFPKDYHDFVIDNTGTIEEFETKVRNVWREVNGLRGRNLFPQ